MGASAGSLVVSLGLDAAEYTKGLTRAEYQARQFGEALGIGIRNAAGLAAGALALLGPSAGGAVAGFDALIKSAGDFQDLAEVTGGSAEGLASFGVAAGTAGTSVEAIAQASVKLTKNLTGVDDESKAAGAAIAALGLSLKDFKALAPEDQISAISKSLGGFRDGAGKTAVATALLGKSGAELLPFLKALEEQGGRQVILTAEQISQADDYGDKQSKLKAEIGQYAQLLAVQALPAMTAFTGAISDSAREMLGLDGKTTDLKNNNGVADFAEASVRALGFLVDAGDGVVRVFSAIGTTIGAAAAQTVAAASGEFKQVLSIGKSWQQDMSALLDKPLFSTKLNARLEQQKRDAAAAVGGSPVKLPQLVFDGAGKKAGSGSDATKNMLDNQLKALENGVKEEEDILRSRNKMLDLYNGENLLSTQSYFEGKLATQSAAVSSQQALYDQEIAALEAYQAKAGKATEREAAQGKINDLLEKKKRLTREAGELAIEWGFKERKAAEDLSRQINSVNADVLELTGNLGAASRLRIDDQYGELSKRLTAEGNTGALEQLGRLKELKVAQADYNQQQADAADLLAGLRIQEDRIAIARQLGASGELESLQQLGVARQGTVEQLSKIVDAQRAIALLSDNKALILNAEQAKLALDQLAASADPLAEKFNGLFADNAAGAFTDFINGTKSAKQAFSSFLTGVTSELTNLIAKDLFKKLFSGGTGDGGGFNVGGLLSSIFGGGRASGGLLNANTMYRVNENGPELLDVNGKQYLMNGSRSASVTANHRLSDGGGFSQTNQFVVSGRIDRSTETQLANKVRRQTNTAAARFS